MLNPGMNSEWRLSACGQLPGNNLREPRVILLPGQGIFTILIGVMLLNFPGKYQLEQWIVARRPVLHSINWLRRRAGRAALVLDG